MKELTFDLDIFGAVFHLDHILVTFKDSKFTVRGGKNLRVEIIFGAATTDGGRGYVISSFVLNTNLNMNIADVEFLCATVAVATSSEDLINLSI